MLLCAALGQAWSQEVTLDFTDSSWGFPTTKVVQATSYTNSDGYTITVEGTTGNGFRVYSNPAYFLFGQQGASITLPAFDFDVDKIEVEGRSGASSATLMNVFVGDVAVSTQTKGCQETNTYFIDNNYQDAGNVYKLKVVSAHNAQVTKIHIYEKGTSGPVDPEVTLTTTAIKVGETTSISFPSNLSVSYVSNATGVATVDANGVITGVGEGTATIKATWDADNNYNAGSKEFTVTVSKYDAEVTLSTTSIKVGKTATISYPEDLTSILFGSDNESVATVNEDGVITGVSAGEATITAMWGDNKYNDGETEFTITVAEANVGVAFVKVTNLNQVVAGNQYVLVTENGIAMGAQNGTFRDEVEIDLDGNVAYVNDNVAVLTLGGKAGAWTFSDTSGELSFISDENNQLVTKTDATDAQKLWRISDDFQVWHKAFPGRTIQDNTDAAHFGCFKSTQSPSYLYVKQGSAIDENYKKDPVFSIANATIELNSNAKRLKVNTPSDGAITFTDITIATISSNDNGSYLVEAKEEGEATVTATLKATDEYEGDETTFTVTVVPAHSNIASHLYKKVTSDDDLTAGKYLIVYEDNTLAFDGSLTTLDAASNTISVSIKDNKIFCDEDVYFLIDPEAGTIRSASGNYIGVTTNSNGLKQSTNANAYKNDFSIDEDDNAVIYADYSNSTMYLRFNKGSGQERFRYYKTNNGVQQQQPIQLYKAVDPFPFSIKEIAYDGIDHYATISALGSEPYYEVSGGVEVFTLSVDQHKLVFSAPFTDGDVIPTKDASGKDVAYLVRGDVGDYQFTAAATPENPVTLGENLLVSSGENGVTSEEMAEAHDNGYVFYKLSIHPRTKKAGFFWGAENGAAFDYTTGHQAYLAVPPAKLTTQSVSGYYFDGTTGIEELTIPQVVNDNTAYTLSGIRMTGKNLPKGVYVVNGKKMVVK